MLKVEHLTKTYDRRTRHANTVLRDLSFTLPDQGFVCILGASGCGKTSLLNAIGGLDDYDSGLIETERATVRRPLSRTMEHERNASFGYIFQNYYLLSEHSVAYNVYLGMHTLDITEKEKMRRVKDALTRVDMLRYQKRPVCELSGGQQQRVAIARAIARRPRVIFADEPTGNLDEANTLNICTILKELSRSSLVVMVTHEERIARFFADRIITMEQGTILSDTEDWERKSLDAGEKDTIYSADYTENTLSTAGLELRVLRGEGTAPISLTLVVEDSRVVLKVNDTRTVLCSKPSSAPYLKEGERPILHAHSIGLVTNTKDTEDKGEVKGKHTKRRGQGLRSLLREAVHLSAGKRRRGIGIGIFVILLSVMLSLTVADVITIAHIDPETFISTNSHTLAVSFKRGEDLTFDLSGAESSTLHESLQPYIKDYMAYLDKSGLDIDYLFNVKANLTYVDSTIPQFDELILNFAYEDYADVDRLDPEDLIYGRMPENSREIVIDRWVIEKTLAKDGILQNVIPGVEYFLDKQLICNKKAYAPTVVGICDSGEPTIYISKTAFLSLSAFGIQVITPEEFTAITGKTDLPELGLNEGILLREERYEELIGKDYNITRNFIVTVKDGLLYYDPRVRAEVIVSQETLDALFPQLLTISEEFFIFCSDKAALKEYMAKPLPEELDGKIAVAITDKYERSYNEYMEHVTARIDARTIVTAAILFMSVVMLYIMQRAKIRSHMDLVAVYRLLGIPKSNLVTIFAVESLISTCKFAFPSVLLSWGGIELVNLLNAGDVLIYPFWAVLATLGAIAILRVLMAILPVLRLMSHPPARLAAKYDF